jgi:hypothetical protein
MKSKILLLIFSTLWFSCSEPEDLVAQTSVPNTETFSLQDVYDVISNQLPDIGLPALTLDLASCFTHAVADYFDPTYNNDEYAPPNSLLRFRNYAIQEGIGEACGDPISYVGGQSYPSVTNIVLGTGTGTVTLTFDAYAIPDLYIIEWDNGRTFSEYRGNAAYDYGGAQRNYFKSNLFGKTNPIYPDAYPDYFHYPDDGYPRVFSGTGTVTFSKTTATPTVAAVKVYAPIADTDWTYTLSCPD